MYKMESIPNSMIVMKQKEKYICTKWKVYLIV